MAKETISQTEGLAREAVTNIRNAYDRGYKQGYKDGKADVVTTSYEKGLNDAWECLKKIVFEKCDDGLTFTEIIKIFDGKCLTSEILNGYSPSEAIAKIKEYEKKQEQADDEIEVGDEVIEGKVFNSGKGIVTFVSPIVTYVVWYDGSTGRRKLEDLKKTGRHFDKISEILEQLKEV